MQRAVSSLPLGSGLLVKLAASGFDTVEELKCLGVVELSREIGISCSQALEIIQVARGEDATRAAPPQSPTHTPSPHTTSTSPHPTSPPPLPSLGSPASSLPGCSALDLLRREQLHGGHIVTFCACIDEILGGGVPLGKVTEFCGAPGTGKTQISMQLAVDVSIPDVLGGMGGEAVYIDTEGSFIVERAADMAAAMLHHLTTVAEASNDEAMSQASHLLSLQHVLSHIHYFRCHDYLELVATVNLLREFLSTHSQVRLVIIDSIACHFRYGFDDMSQRNRVLLSLSQTLIHIATLHNIAVVLTNQMTTKASHRGQTTTHLVPALGESWGHTSTVRVVFFWSGSQRMAALHKSPSHRETTVPFVITEDGVRDITSLSSQDPNSQVPPTSQLALPTEEGGEESDFSETDELIAHLPDPPLWTGGRDEKEGAGRVRGRGGGGRGGDEERAGGGRGGDGERAGGGDGERTGGGRGGGGGGRGGGGEGDRDFVSVSELHYTQDNSEEVSEAKRRKHCHCTDHEM